MSLNRKRMTGSLLGENDKPNDKKKVDEIDEMENEDDDDDSLNSDDDDESIVVKDDEDDDEDDEEKDNEDEDYKDDEGYDGEPQDIRVINNNDELGFGLHDNDSDDDVDDDEYEEDLQKFNDYSLINELENQHPEIKQVNYDEVMALSRVVRNNRGDIIDPLHTTLPIITKYEKARVIGARAEQINRGAPPFVEVEPSIIDGRIIATMEYEEKKIPFIFARPLPSGSVEYWKLEDLELL
jgi:DNA-directed RNA polymerase I, II, and III subunit RPABC2